MSTLGVVAALPAEGRTLSNRLQAAGTLDRPIPGLLLSICGVGHNSACQAARELVHQGADALVSWGCGVGLTNSSYPGQVFLPQVVIDTNDKQQHAVDSRWHTRLGDMLKNAGIAYETAPLVTVNSMLTDIDSKQLLHQENGAGIADMESTAIAAVAAENRRPFLCVRAVADDLSVTLPPLLLPALDRYGRPRTIELLRLLLRHPGLIPQLLKLGQAYSQARRSLASVAAVSGRKLAFDSWTET